MLIFTAILWDNDAIYTFKTFFPPNLSLLAKDELNTNVGKYILKFIRIAHQQAVASPQLQGYKILSTWLN